MPRILLTGNPGCGKTTLLRRVVDYLGEAAGGFYTVEVRDERGQRIGFRVITTQGESGWLARSGQTSGRFHLGRYQVDLTALEQIGVTAIRNALAADQVVIIDEIGPMELFSVAFQRTVLMALEQAPDLLATVVARSHPFADQIKTLTGVQLIWVDAANRERLASQISEQFRDHAVPPSRMTI